MLFKRAIHLMALCLPAPVAGAALITVGPGLDAETISDALVLAADGDEVALASGTWVAAAAGEPVLWLQQRSLVVRALDANDPPVLDGGATGRAVVADGGIVVLQDLVLRGGAIPGGDLDGDGVTADWERSGGAITMHVADVTMERVWIDGGSAFHGGCIGAWASDLACIDMDVTAGTATFFGGGMRVHGGSLTWSGGVLSNCLADTGGGLVAGGGCDVSLSQVAVQSCQATWFGGGACLDSSQSSVNAVFSAVSVSMCSAGGGGGGVYVYGGVLQASDLTVELCTADNGAGIDAIDTVLVISVGSLRNNTASDEGGGIRVIDGSALIEHVTVQGNAAVYGGGVLLDWCESPLLLDVSCSDNDAVLRGGALYATGASNTFVTECNVSSNTAGLGVDGMVFASSNAGQVSGTEFCGQAVHVGGTWVDLGDNTFDDVCAGSACAGDVDGSGQVGPGDVVELIYLWGGGSGAADCDGDGLVGVLDLIIVLRRWGLVC